MYTYDQLNMSAIEMECPPKDIYSGDAMNKYDSNEKRKAFLGSNIFPLVAGLISMLEVPRLPRIYKFLLI